MAKSTVNKKIGKAAGINDINTVLNCIDFRQKVQEQKKEINEEWELENKGKLHKSVMESLQPKLGISEQENYMTIKAYANTIKDIEARGMNSKSRNDEEEMK